jgi:O-acetyl-ADP-ribose deacetylase (regulator of RNase III)
MHQANCFSTMGAGIAKQIKEKFPEAYKADLDDPRTPKEKLGSFSCAICDNDRLIVINLYGQYNYGSNPHTCYTDYVALTTAIRSAIEAIKSSGRDMKDIKIGLPGLIGAGLAGGDKFIIHGLLENISIDLNIDLYLYFLK